jgi:BirA family biotin operon repressor/biotin-[acetyl-CoA-carboxylase] ligase
MAFALGAGARENGYSLTALAETGSTNAEALAHARAGGRGKTWFVSDRQTAGRGRRGSEWQTEKGNLAASLLLLVDQEPAAAAKLGFVAGLALDEALRRVAPSLALQMALDGFEGRGPAGERDRLRLKWPNDVLLDGGKLAGILLEAEALGSGGLAVVVGIGVNIVTAPKGLPYSAVALRPLGFAVDAPGLFLALAEAWTAVDKVWNGGRGFPEIRKLWLDRAAGIGEPAAVRIGGQILSGTFETIDDAGRLVIRAGDGTRRTVAAGEVHFGAVASARQ